MASSADSTHLDVGIAIHGGVGTLKREALTPELEKAYRVTLRASLEAGRSALEGGGGALDAVVEAVRVMEDSPLFNAGRGSNFDERGVVTMDASIMAGPEQDAGAVAGVTGVRSPVELARHVMEHSDHVLLIGEGAEAFARRRDLAFETPDFFHTDRRWSELQRARTSGSRRPNVLGGDEGDVDPSPDPTDRTGTVGAVARDATGALAAATSTGGMANKTWGRVGDSPVIGAGTYASDLCAVSCTGWGEYFIRLAAAYDVHARMEHGGATLAEAVRGVVFERLHRVVPGSGGMVAIDRAGHVQLEFNTPGMYRGWMRLGGDSHIAIFE